MHPSISHVIKTAVLMASEIGATAFIVEDIR